MFKFLLKIKTFLTLNTLVLILKIGYTLFFNPQFSGYEDWSIANKLVKYGTYSEILNVGPSTLKLPAYPYFLSFFIYFFGDNAPHFILISQHILYFFIPIGIIRILQLLGQKNVGIVAAYLFVLSPAYLYYSFMVEATNIFIPLSVVWAIMGIKIYTGIWKSNTNFVLWGLVTALLFLTQVVVVPILLALIAILLLYKKISFKNARITLIIAVLGYSPWIIRNAITFHKFIPTKSPYYHNLYTSFTESNNILGPLKIFSDEEAKYLFHYRANVSEIEMEKVFHKELEMKVKPQDYTLKALQNAVLLWYVPARYFYDNSWEIWVARKAYVLLINGLTILALVQWFRKQREVFFLLILLFAGFTLPYMIGHAANIRFKLDFEWIQLIVVGHYMLFQLKKITDLQRHKTK